MFFVAYLGFAITANVAVAGVLFALYGLFQGLFRVAGKALASDLVPAELRASGIGWYGTAVGLSGIVAGIIAGLLWDRVGHAAVFAYGAAMTVSGAIALALLVPARDAGSR